MCPPLSHIVRHPCIRAGALVGVNWMQGSNPLGRPFTTGLGHTPMVSKTILKHNAGIGLLEVCW
jgi:hypothetical protein